MGTAIHKKVLVNVAIPIYMNLSCIWKFFYLPVMLALLPLDIKVYIFAFIPWPAYEAAPLVEIQRLRHCQSSVLLCHVRWRHLRDMNIVSLFPGLPQTIRQENLYLFLICLRYYEQKLILKFFFVKPINSPKHFCIPNLKLKKICCCKKKEKTNKKNHSVFKGGLMVQCTALHCTAMQCQES